MVLKLVSPKEATRISNSLMRVGISNTVYVDPDKKIYKVHVKTRVDKQDKIDKILNRYSSKIIDRSVEKPKLRVLSLQ